MVIDQESLNISGGEFSIPGFVLRRLVASDIKDFIDLGLPTCAFMHGRPEMPESRMRQTFTSFVREHAFTQDSEIYVLEGPDREHAAQLWLHLTRNRFNHRRELWIWDITVRTEFRRKGLAKQMLEFAKHRAAVLRSEELWLLVSSINDTAIQLYKTCGMRSLGLLMCSPIGRSVREEHSITLRSAVLNPIREQDAEALHELWTAAGLDFRPRGRDSLPRLRAFLNGTHDMGWAAFVENRMIGAALATYDGRKGWIERLAVLPEYRGAGLAKAIVAACTNTLKSQGALIIAALIETDNRASRQLFESCGFRFKPEICYHTLRESNDS